MKKIVSLVGHVDNGKTSIISSLLKSKISEDFNITQNIFLYNYKKFIIIDTPGHLFFNDLRKSILAFSDVVLIVISKNYIEEDTKKIINFMKKKT